jgi:hypothetical protein
MEPPTTQDTDKTTAPKTHTCTHTRLIADVLTRNKKKTGKVRCLECRAIFDDPYYDVKCHD